MFAAASSAKVRLDLVFFSFSSFSRTLSTFFFPPSSSSLFFGLLEISSQSEVNTFLLPPRAAPETSTDPFASYLPFSSFSLSQNQDTSSPTHPPLDFTSEKVRPLFLF